MANNGKCPTGYSLNGKGECVPNVPLKPIPTSTVKINKSDTLVKKEPKTVAMSKQEFRDKKKLVNQERKLQDLQNGVPSRFGRTTRDVILQVGAAAAAGLGVKNLLKSDRDKNGYRNGGKATTKK